MEAMKNPEYLRATAQAVVAFREALDGFLELHVVNANFNRGTTPALIRRYEAHPDDVAKRLTTVSAAAARASMAPSLTGVELSVPGYGVIDPIVSWDTLAESRSLLQVSEVRAACAEILGRLEQFEAKAKAELRAAGGGGGGGPATMHPIVAEAAAENWNDGQYRAAVVKAVEAVALKAKDMTGQHDLPEALLWQEVFNPAEPTARRTRLRWPGEPGDRFAKLMNDGMRLLAPGIQLTLRNAVPAGAPELDEQEALERLGAISLLARCIEQCTVMKASPY